MPDLYLQPCAIDTVISDTVGRDQVIEISRGICLFQYYKTCPIICLVTLHTWIAAVGVLSSVPFYNRCRSVRVKWRFECNLKSALKSNSLDYRQWRLRLHRNGKRCAQFVCITMRHLKETKWLPRVTVLWVDTTVYLSYEEFAMKKNIERSQGFSKPLLLQQCKEIKPKAIKKS